MRAAVAFALLLGACAGNDPASHAPLQIDVVRGHGSVWVQAFEAGTTPSCTNMFPEVGTADGTTDVLSCDTPTADWLSAIRFENDDAVVEEIAWEPPEWPAIELGAATHAVLVADDGDELRLALPADPGPVPTIDSAQLI